MFIYSELNSNNNITKVANLEELKANPKLTSFMMELNAMPIKETLEEMCIEIAKRTPDVKTNKDGRLNPYVGALLISKDKNAIKVYGACRSAVHDGEHGECGLLTNLLGQYVAEGCEMFVSLEPCTQDSRHEWTEPCCEIIHNRRIKKVTIGMLDPNPDVAGHGIRYLINKGVEVELFTPKNQKRVMEQNEKFSEQFGQDGDPKTNRKIALSLNEFISDEAINKFLKDSNDEFSLKIQGRNSDTKTIFYKKMIENQSIVDGGKLLPFKAIDEFALFFYNKPFHFVDGATIRFICDFDYSQENKDLPSNDFNGPLIFAFESKESNDKKLLGFVEYLGKVYSKSQLPRSLVEYNKYGLEFIESKFGKGGLKIVREAFINAIMHRDYKDNYSFTKITLTNEYIKIENPVSNKAGKIDELKRAFSTKTIPSRVINPKLMRYFMLINMCERNGHGFSDFSKANYITFNLRDDFVLETILKFKENS